MLRSRRAGREKQSAIRTGRGRIFDSRGQLVVLRDHLLQGFRNAGTEMGFAVRGAGEEALQPQETGEAAHGEAEGAEQTEVVLDAVDCVAQLLDVADVNPEQQDLVVDPGKIAGLWVFRGNRTETRGIVAVFEGVGVAGRGAAFLARGRATARGGRSREVGHGETLLDWERKRKSSSYIIEHRF